MMLDFSPPCPGLFLRRDREGPGVGKTLIICYISLTTTAAGVTSVGRDTKKFVGCLYNLR